MPEEVPSSTEDSSHVLEYSYQQQQQQQQQQQYPFVPALMDGMTEISVSDIAGTEELQKHAKAILYLQNLMGEVSQQHNQASMALPPLTDRGTAGGQALPKSQVLLWR